MEKPEAEKEASENDVGQVLQGMDLRRAFPYSGEAGMKVTPESYSTLGNGVSLS